ncbi:MAG: purine-nucleoside phosphorylase [Gemmatimonadetes bacterium]|nr:purine-nucleoside phosphorylase [Gemmatimonadota bacterium]NNL31409.1 purine-nucleoside phosphorylase [Gemmatimonadota bacterium]
MKRPVDVVGAAAFLDGHLPSVPRLAIVVGSGLGALQSALADAVHIPFAEVPGLPATTVAGHSGAFVHGRLGDTEVLVQAGRFHLYEGLPLDVVVGPVRILARLGVESLVFTNAAGAIHPLMQPGDVVILEDLLNLQFRSPLGGPVREGEERFPDMSDPLDRGMRSVLREAATALGVGVQEGVYAAVSGPAYETRAEVRMLQRMGADLVGMSTVPEIVVAAARGLPCGALSLVTNRATGLSTTSLSHREVLEMGRLAGDRVVSLLRQAAPKLGQSGEAK